MQSFKIKAINKEGDRIALSREAPSREHLLRDLRASGHHPLRIKVVGDRKGGPARKYPHRVILDWTETMSLLLGSGLSLKDALEITKTIHDRGPIRKIADQMSADIEKGLSLSQTMDKLGASFPSIFQGLLRIGERMGSLEAVFQRLSMYMRERQGFREKIVNALAYPLFILSAAILGIVFLSIIIVPRIISIYEEIGLGLPTQLLERMSFFRGILVALGVLVVTILASSLIVRWIRYQIESLRVFWDRILLRIPFAGKFLLYRDSLSFLFAMETLIGSGFTVEDGMKEAIPTMDNSAIRMNLQLVIKRIEKGTQLSQAFAEENLFPKRIVQWIAVGERSGNVKAVFGQLRNYYQEEIKRWSTRVVAFAEPAFIVLVGIIVVSFLLVFILPIFTIYRDLL